MPSGTSSSAKSVRRPAKRRAPRTPAARPAVANPLSRTDLSRANAALELASAEERIGWTLEHFPKEVILSSSFGAQSAVLLHMATQQRPRIPVVLVDTGYLFAETYQFVDELTKRLKLNLKIYRAETSAAWQEARFGKLWEQGVEGLEQYNRMNKVEPMNRALKSLKAKAWISGVRRDQSDTREGMGVLGSKNGVLRVHPIIDWNDWKIFDYLKKFDLPYHPLWDQGYISIGDWHTSHRLTDYDDPSQSRFFGLTRECGLHLEVESVVDYNI